MSNTPAFRLGPRVLRPVLRPYEARDGDPPHRTLRLYVTDPAMEGDTATALVRVPYEPLEPGPIGASIEVDAYDAVRRRHSRSADLDDAVVRAQHGHAPSTSDARFHQQMVYGVASLVQNTFRRALGRDTTWGFERNDGNQLRLRMRPHASDDRNAHYDRKAGELCFGYFASESGAGGDPYVFTCLSHDVIVHEASHALLDGLRAHFVHPSNPDVLAFHEAFADLVTLFQRFTYPELVRAEIHRARGDVRAAELLTSIARQLGQATGAGKALRSAVSDGAEANGDVRRPHERSRVLVAAVFDAFCVLYERRTERLVRLASGGERLLHMGALPNALEELLAEQASRLASHFLSICIRAVDYCPPVDIEFGEYLRAMITADHDLVVDDPWRYREALIQSFCRRRIPVHGAGDLSENELLWRHPDLEIPPLTELSFSRLAFDGDPGRADSAREQRRQARAVGRLVTNPAYVRAFGCALPDDPDLAGDAVERPVVESVRVTRRVGPDGQVAFGLVAEVTQRRVSGGKRARNATGVYGGATILFDARGRVRYVVTKSVTRR